MFLVGVLQHSQPFFSYKERLLGLTQYQMYKTLSQREPESQSQTIYHSQELAPQSYGESCVLLMVNRSGESRKHAIKIIAQMRDHA